MWPVPIVIAQGLTKRLLHGEWRRITHKAVPVSVCREDLLEVALAGRAGDAALTEALVTRVTTHQVPTITTQCAVYLTSFFNCKRTIPELVQTVLQ